jgi:hypothetical protein
MATNQPIHILRVPGRLLRGGMSKRHPATRLGCYWCRDITTLVKPPIIKNQGGINQPHREAKPPRGQPSRIAEVVQRRRPFLKWLEGCYVRKGNILTIGVAGLPPGRPTGPAPRGGGYGYGSGPRGAGKLYISTSRGVTMEVARPTPLRPRSGWISG